MDGRPEPLQRGEMLRHAVAHMALEPVARMCEAELRHQPVARDLGDDGSSRYGQHQGIAADHRLAFAVDLDAVAAIHEHELRFPWKRRDRKSTRLNSSHLGIS